RHVVGRVLAPPPVPRLVPRPVAATEHPPAHDERAHAAREPLGDVGVGAVRTALQAVLRAPAAGRDDPVVQALAALAERVLGALVGPGAEPVERYGAVRVDFAHGL